MRCFISGVLAIFFAGIAIGAATAGPLDGNHTLQAAIPAGGGPAQLPSSGGYTNGFTLCADDNNAAPVTIGFSNQLNAKADGTGNGFIRRPGNCVGINSADTHSVWIAGNPGDIVSVIGN